MDDHTPFTYPLQLSDSRQRTALTHGGFTPPPPMPTPEPPSVGETAAIDFMGLLHVLTRFWWVPLLTVALCAGGMFAWLKKTPRFYTTTAVLAVEQENIPLVPSGSTHVEDMKSLDVLKSIELEIISQEVLVYVAKKFGLDHDPILAGSLAETGLKPDQMVWLLGNRIKAQVEKGTRLITISVEDTNAQRAQDVAQAIVERAITKGGSAGSGTSTETLKLLEKQTTDALNRMENARSLVNKYREKFPLLPLTESSSELKINPIEGKINQINTEAVTARTEMTTSSAIVAQITAAGNDVAKLLAIPGFQEQETIVDSFNNLKRAENAFRTTDWDYKSPTYKNLKSQAESMQAALLAALQSSANSERAKLAKAQGNVQRLTADLAEAKRQENEFASIAGDFRRLALDVKTSEDAYQNIMAHQREAEANAFGGNALRIVHLPLLPTSANKPNKMYYLLASGILGLVGGLGVVLLLALLDNRVRNIATGERLLRMPGLAAIPVATIHSLKDMLLPTETGGSPSAEAFRGLRTALSILGKGTTAKSFLFTSAHEGEGKSYCALNFAVSLAQQGFRTLLIDANLRKPVLDSILHGARAETGLADHLMGLAERDAKICQPTAISNLYLFSAGIPKAHPGEVLNDQAFAKLVHDALKWFHKVVVDTSAVGIYPEALPLARHIDSICLVTRVGVSKKSATHKAVERLAACGARPAGFILNAAGKKALNGAFAGDFAAGFAPAPLLPALPPASR